MSCSHSAGSHDNFGNAIWFLKIDWHFDVDVMRKHWKYACIEFQGIATSHLGRQCQEKTSSTSWLLMLAPTFLLCAQAEVVLNKHLEDCNMPSSWATCTDEYTCTKQESRSKERFLLHTVHLLFVIPRVVASSTGNECERRQLGKRNRTELKKRVGSNKVFIHVPAFQLLRNSGTRTGNCNYIVKLLRCVTPRRVVIKTSIQCIK